jgi:hypothetical protein
VYIIYVNFIGGLMTKSKKIKKRKNPFDNMPLDKQIETAKKIIKKAKNPGFKRYWEKRLAELEKKKKLH